MSGFRNLDGVERLEEENWDWYTCQTFYSPKIGEVFEVRYQVIGKLGYGSLPLHGFAVIYGRLSVRLSRRALVNIKLIYSAHKYIVLKICEQNSKSVEREIAAYKHLSSITTEHPGALFLRKLCDTFRI